MQRRITPLALALSCLTAVLTPTAIDLGTCDDRVERMRHTFAVLKTFDALHVQDESWPLPVSPHGTSMYAADDGRLEYGPTTEHDWPDIAELLADIDTDAARPAWDRRANRTPRPILYLALRPDVAIKHHWPALIKLASTHELRLVVATPEPPPLAPPVPEWMAEQLAGRVLTASNGFARLDELRDIWALADTCPLEIDICTQFGWREEQQLALWIKRAERCHCAMIDEQAMTAIAWRAFAPQGPPQRWLPLRIATKVDDQRRIETTYVASAATPSEILLPPNSVTVGLLVQHLASDSTPIFHVGEPRPSPPPEPPERRRTARTKPAPRGAP